MNGKDIFLGLKYVGDDLIEKAEYGQFPTKAEHTATQKKRMSIRRPFLIAAIIALLLMLVGCAVVYVLSMQEIKLGEQEVIQDVFEYDPRTGVAVAYVGRESIRQQVESRYLKAFPQLRDKYSTHFCHSADGVTL